MTPDQYAAKCYWLAAFYKEAAEKGQAIQMANIDGWTDSTLGPIPQSDPRDWRLKPKPQKAWVVWNDRCAVCIAISKEEAERSASFYKGTIQEITRPEPQ